MHWLINWLIVVVVVVVVVVVFKSLFWINCCSDVNTGEKKGHIVKLWGAIGVFTNAHVRNFLLSPSSSFLPCHIFFSSRYSPSLPNSLVVFFPRAFYGSDLFHTTCSTELRVHVALWHGPRGRCAFAGRGVLAQRVDVPKDVVGLKYNCTIDAFNSTPSK